MAPANPTSARRATSSGMRSGNRRRRRTDFVRRRRRWRSGGLRQLQQLPVRTAWDRNERFQFHSLERFGGGTDFYYSSYNQSSAAQQSQLESYWDTVQTIFPTTSLLQPIPEQPWNNPFGLNLANGGVYQPIIRILSPAAADRALARLALMLRRHVCILHGRISETCLQSGKGVPNDGVRDLPDVHCLPRRGKITAFTRSAPVRGTALFPTET